MNVCVEVSVHSHVYDRYICSAIKNNIYLPFYRLVDVTVNLRRSNVANADIHSWACLEVRKTTMYAYDWHRV